MDTNRAFANQLPHFAAFNGKTPTLTANDQRQFNALCEGHSMPFISQLWNLNLIGYNTNGNIGIDASAVKEAAAQFMRECKDCAYGLAYEVNVHNEAMQCFYSPENAAKHLINHKGYQAQAILLAAYLSGTRLTSAQRKRLESAANGRYLEDKYSQFSSGARGTLTPVIKFHGAYTGSESQRQDFIEYGREARLGLSYGKPIPFTAYLNL